MKPAQLPDIDAAAREVRRIIEEAVQRFARKHRYPFGQELRAIAEQVRLHLQLAWLYPNRRITHVQAASDAIDLLKLRIQLGEDVKAFVSLDQCEMIGRHVTALGQQCGGWLNATREKGRNAQVSRPAQRAQILSSHAASPEARA